MTEVLFIICMLGGMIILPLVLQMWALFFVMLTFSVIFGSMEALYKWRTGKTVSQKFWEYKKLHPVKGWVILGGMLVAWIALLIHLGG